MIGKMLLCVAASNKTPVKMTPADLSLLSSPTDSLVNKLAPCLGETDCTMSICIDKNQLSAAVQCVLIIVSYST